MQSLDVREALTLRGTRADTHLVAPEISLREHRRRLRLSDEAGYSLMELLVVLMIIGILATVGASVYVGMREEGNTTAAELNVREAVGAAHTYYADNETYDGMTRAALVAIDGGVKLSREPVISADGRRYCLESTHNGNAPSAPSEPGKNPHSYEGPDGQVVPASCPASI